MHHNTLVVARAGSGKTRVIVAKVVYLVAKLGFRLDEIAIFMFNRTAAAEVNQRIAAVAVDGQPLTETVPAIASTFHKFALDIVKLQGYKPEIITEEAQSNLIETALQRSLKSLGQHPSPSELQEIRQVVSSFIVRAGQKFPGLAGRENLATEVKAYIAKHEADSSFERKILFHQVAELAYGYYLESLKPPLVDFNLLMAQATEILQSDPGPKVSERIRPLRYLMIDEYQDFSYLFYALTMAVRQLAPSAHLFAVGDDWQAINRFAGSEVDYFLSFAKYFSEDCVTIPLATNYRSCRKIVEYANRYMLRHYDQNAIPAVAFNHKSGKIHSLALDRLKFQADDWQEDGIGDARFQKALLGACHLSETPENYRQLLLAAKMLKMLVKIMKRHPRAEFMLLHRHNFTSCQGVDLEALATALKTVLDNEEIMSTETFDRQVRIMTMHKSKGLEAKIVILLEMDAENIFGHHPQGTIFELFGDTLATETADQQRLIYVALTRAKQRLYLLSQGKNPLF